MNKIILTEQRVRGKELSLSEKSAKYNKKQIYFCYDTSCRAGAQIKCLDDKVE